MDRNLSKILEIERRAFFFFSASWLVASLGVLIVANFNFAVAKIFELFFIPILGIRFITLGIVYSIVGNFSIYKQALFFKLNVPIFKFQIRSDAVMIVISTLGWLFVAFTL